MMIKTPWGPMALEMEDVGMKMVRFELHRGEAGRGKAHRRIAVNPENTTVVETDDSVLLLVGESGLTYRINHSLEVAQAMLEQASSRGDTGASLPPESYLALLTVEETKMVCDCINLALLRPGWDDELKEFARAILEKLEGLLE